MTRLSPASVVRQIKKAHADRVAVLRLEGHIGGGMPGPKGLTIESLEPNLKRAFSLDRVKAVVLVINSPGGSPAQSEYIAERIRQLSSEKGVRVLAFCEDVAASGGYWIACAADEIYAARTSMLGSIGVISAGFGVPGLIDKWGVERRVYAAGDNKSRLDMFQPVQPEDVEWIKGIQSQLHQTFIDWVRQRRGSKLVGDVFDGDVYLGRQAVDVGLADGVGVMRSVLAERYPDAEIELIESPKPLLARLTGGQASMATSVESAVTGLWAAMDKRNRWASFGL